MAEHTTSGAKRVVSLLPSTTEIIAALGHVDRVVGRSHECDFPSGVEQLPVISRPRREPVGTSADIDRGVVQLLGEVLSIYRVDPDALREADPDLIVTQDLCRVCAVAEEEVLAAARTHLDGDVDVLTSSPMTLAQVFADVERLAAALGDPGAGAELVAAMRTDLDELSAAVGQRVRPTLALLEWADPLMTGGNWAPELVAAAGCESVLANAGGHSPAISMDELRAADPEVILVAPCGYDLERTLQDHELLAGQPGWHELRAVKDGRVAYADGSAYFNRPGPRLVDSAAIVAAVAHGLGPALPLEGTAWRFAPSA